MTNVKLYVVFSVVLTLLGIVSFWYLQSYWLLLGVWLFRTVGNGVVGHRYFAHNQFTVGPISRKLFAYYTTMSSYSTPIYWIVQHLHHHRNSDSSTDVHSPRNGIMNSLLLWSFRPSMITSVFSDRSSKIMLIKASKDADVLRASRHFYLINTIAYGVIFFISVDLFFAWAASYVIELIKYGTINAILHLHKFPGNYRNHNLSDDSQNNLLIGFISLGFGWHNNHHTDPKKLDLQEKWWEYDIEAQIGKIFSKILRF